jgi:hypothetical protein
MNYFKMSFFLLVSTLLIFSGLVFYNTLQTNLLDKSHQLRMQHLLAP